MGKSSTGKLIARAAFGIVAVILTGLLVWVCAYHFFRDRSSDVVAHQCRFQSGIGGILSLTCADHQPDGGVVVVGDAQRVMAGGDRHTVEMYRQLAALGPTDVTWHRSTNGLGRILKPLPSLVDISKDGVAVRLTDSVDGVHVAKKCHVTSTDLPSLLVATSNCGVLTAVGGEQSPFGTMAVGQDYDLTIDESGKIVAATASKD